MNNSKIVSSSELQNIAKLAFPYALGYWQGRSTGYFENGTYENMSDLQRHLFKIGYDAGVADFCEMDMNADLDRARRIA
jgi:hypothetical protein